MAQVVRRPEFTLNSDGRPHPRENALAGVTLAFGAVAFIAGWFDGAHLLATLTGLASLATGAYSQMVSATTGERWLNIVGVVAGAVGLAMGIANGGLEI